MKRDGDDSGHGIEIHLAKWRVSGFLSEFLFGQLSEPAEHLIRSGIPEDHQDLLQSLDFHLGRKQERRDAAFPDCYGLRLDVQIDIDSGRITACDVEIIEYPADRFLIRRKSVQWGQEF